MENKMCDRLIELIKQADDKCGHTSCGECGRFGTEYDCLIGLTADHLIANGVIVPPCKVGDTVYSFIQGSPVIYEGHVYEIIYNGHVCVYRGTRKGYFTHAFSEYDIGRTVFLTREEAEQVLKGGS